MNKNLNGVFFFLFVLLFTINSYCQDKYFPAVEGWKVNIENQIYDSNNLWDLIDGAADLFLEYSFIDLHLARYIAADRTEIKAEIYKHGTSLDAFGMYSQERDPAYHFVQVGAQGYIEEGVLNFLDGIYYIKLSTLQKGEQAQNALTAIAKELDAHLKQPNTMPEELALFPPENKVINSEKYISQNFLGHSFFKSVLTVKYNSIAHFTAFIVITASPAEADKTLNSYLNTLEKENIFKTDSKKYDVEDPQNGLISIRTKNNFLFGLIGFVGGTIRDVYTEKLDKLLK